MEFEISLNDLKFFAYHGVFEEERKIGNEFIVNLSIYVSLNREIDQDNLEGTVSYADLYKIVEEEMMKTHNLLEKLILNITQRIKTDFPTILRGKIRIEKVNPPIPGIRGSASVAFSF